MTDRLPVKSDSKCLWRQLRGAITDSSNSTSNMAKHALSNSENPKAQAQKIQILSVIPLVANNSTPSAGTCLLTLPELSESPVQYPPHLPVLVLRSVCNALPSSRSNKKQVRTDTVLLQLQRENVQQQKHIAVLQRNIRSQNKSARKCLLSSLILAVYFLLASPTSGNESHESEEGDDDTIELSSSVQMQDRRSFNGICNLLRRPRLVPRN